MSITPFIFRCFDLVRVSGVIVLVILYEIGRLWQQFTNMVYFATQFYA